MRRIFVLVAAFSFLFCVSAHAQQSAPTLPHLIRISATVSASEAPARAGKAVGITFALYKDQTGGAPLWQEVQNVALDAAGHYSILLGSSSKDGVPLELFASNEARWLGVQVEQEPEQPRVLLVSVPYALKAGDAETLGGKPVSAFLLANFSSAPATASSSPVNSVAALTSAFSASAPTGTGSQYYLARWIDGSGTLGNSTIFDNGSAFIVIGQNIPGSMLDVNGLLHIGAHAQQTAGYEQFILGQNSAVIGTADGNSVLFRITHDVPSGSPSTGLLFQFRQNDNTGANLWGYSMKQVKNAGEDSTYLQFQTNSTIGGAVERMRIDKNGNVGIGTTTPAAKLDVNGGMIVRSGGITFPDNTQQTSAGTISGVVAGAGLTGGGTSGSATLALSTSARTRGINVLVGCDTCGLLADTDDQKAFYVNVVGAMTFQSVTCFSDAGTPVINIQREGVGNVLSSDLTCSTTGAASTSFSDAALNLNDKLDFVMVTAGGAAHRVTVVIKTLLN